MRTRNFLTTKRIERVCQQLEKQRRNSCLVPLIAEKTSIKGTTSMKQFLVRSKPRAFQGFDASDTQAVSNYFTFKLAHLLRAFNVVNPRGAQALALSTKAFNICWRVRLCPLARLPPPPLFSGCETLEQETEGQALQIPHTSHGGLLCLFGVFLHTELVSLRTRSLPFFSPHLVFVVVVAGGGGGGGRRRGRRAEVVGGGAAVTGGACGDKHKTPRSIALVPILIFLLNSAGRY